MRSLSRNPSKLQNLLETINDMFSVNGISETSLKKISHAVDIDGYTSLHSYRTSQTGGSVGIYMTLDRNFKTRFDLISVDQK